MALFQKSVVNKYLKQQDSDVVAKAYKKFVKYFHNPTIQQNIRERKEEQFQEGFLIELFVNVLDYTLAPNPKFNLTTELKNEKGAKKADGAILSRGHDPLAKPFALGVIELKSTKTKDLEKVRQQAFDYKAHQTGCVYVITSNFEKIRFYINNAVEFEEFDLFTINQERFELLYLCLAKDNLLANVPLKIKEASIQEEEKITKKFYADYSLFKRELFRDLVKLNIKNEVFRTELSNEDSERANKNIKHHLFKKSQKLIDRFLFIFFAEDRGLLPPNSTLKILEQWDKLKDLDAYAPLYNRYKLYFNYLDTGRKGTGKSAEIFAYNGGLFKPDAILDSLLISDNLLFKHTAALSNYDFESQVDVNILGHIFENSLNEIESVNSEIEGTDFDKQKTKRKKDGVFYTPKYITKYIVDNTVGKLCEEKKNELNIIEEEYRPKRQKETKKKLLAALEVYRQWLLQLTILDPACGSGAFLNQALDYLIKEHGYIDELQTNLLGGGFVFPNIENTVLENNIFGVDINEESVDIARLSLWLRTAQPRRKLNDLSSNIKCGNSLIDDPKIAGDKAFNWEEEFVQIFKEKEKKAFHITTATHDSRTSQRMIDHKVRLLRDNGTRPKAEGIWLDFESEVLITKTVAEIVKKDNLNVMAFNICGDHMHILLVCEEEEVSRIVGKIKAITSKEYNTRKGITTRSKKSESDTTRGHVPLSREKKKAYNSLWTQKFGNNPIKDDKQLWNTVEYIQNNRIKHGLPPLENEVGNSHSHNNGTCPIVLIEEMCCTYDQAFRTEKKGGFDVVIGNPPYVQSHSIDEKTKEYIYNNFITAEYQINTYAIFVEKIMSLLKKGSFYSIIIPNYWLSTQYDSRLRKLVFLENHCTEILNVFSVFEDATVDTVILTGINNEKIFPKETLVITLDQSHKNIEQRLSAIDSNNWAFSKTVEFENIDSDTLISFDDKLQLKGEQTLGDYFIFKKGMQPYEKGKGKPEQTREMMNNRIYHSLTKIDDTYKPLLKARNVQRFYRNETSGFIKYGANLAAPRNAEIFRGSRILINRILSKSTIDGFYIEEGYINNSDVFNLIPKTSTVNVKALSVFVLSKLCATFFRKENVNLSRAAFPKINVNTLERFPIPKLSEDEVNILEKYASEIASKIENYVKIETSFSKYLQSHFSIEKLSKKLQNWHELEFGDFIKELNKVIVKSNKEVATATTRGHVPLANAPMAKLTKMDEMEWMEVFETKKTEAQTLKAEIDKTDAQIDAMVYELYGLSKEEIKIVEGS